MADMTEPVRPEDVRISDADRQRAARHLQWAQGEGLLDLQEYDERTAALWTTKTRGELARLLRDLPAPPPAATAPARRGVFAPTGGGTAMRVLTIIFSAMLVINVLAWGIVSATTGDAEYPWFLWTALPLGVLGTLYAFGIGRPKSP